MVQPFEHRPFQPDPRAVGGHRQTFLGYWARRHLSWRYPEQVQVVTVAPGIALLARVSWQPGRRDDSPLLLLLHGLEGNDRSTYLLSTGELAYRLGWHVMRLNWRGCGGSEHLTQRIYNAGVVEDLVAVLGWLTEREAVTRLAVVGFSLGGNLALLLAGRQPQDLPPALRALVGVSAPLDLRACSLALEQRENWFYRHYFVYQLKRAYRRRSRLNPKLNPPGRERGARTVRAYDDAVVAPAFGFADAFDYYARASAGPHLGGVAVPTLILTAQDDPMIPAASLRPFAARVNGNVNFELAETGGHCGFVAPSTAPGSFWAADRVLSFCTKQL
jgi:predicted alpha/beta-fold hydrolase